MTQRFDNHQRVHSMACDLRQTGPLDLLTRTAHQIPAVACAYKGFVNGRVRVLIACPKYHETAQPMEKPDNQDDPSSNLDIASFRHQRLGAWDLYTQRAAWSWSALISAPFGSLSTLSSHREDIVYVVRTLRDLWAISSGFIVLYFLALVPNMFVPSIGLW